MAEARGSSGADWCLLGMLLVSAKIGCSSAAELQLRQGFYGSPVPETKGKKARVSAVSTWSKVEGSVWRGKQRNGESVLDAYRGHGGALGRTKGQQRPCGSGSALLAVHERWWREWSGVGRCGMQMGWGAGAR